MAAQKTTQAGPPLQRPAARRTAARPADGTAAARARLAERASAVRILDPALVRDCIRQRQRDGTDRHDEVWDGVYVVPPLANNPHQRLVCGLTAICHEVVALAGLGQVFPGANVSDRDVGWETNFRDPDVVVVLNTGRAVDCTTHWMGGPDFLVEVQSPGDETEEKIAFYAEIQVQELLIVHRDTRDLLLYRFDGRGLVPVGRSDADHPEWVASAVLPLSFRWKSSRTGSATEVKRRGRRKTWTM